MLRRAMSRHRSGGDGRLSPALSGWRPRPGARGHRRAGSPARGSPVRLLQTTRRRSPSPPTTRCTCARSCRVLLRAPNNQPMGFYAPASWWGRAQARCDDAPVREPQSAECPSRGTPSAWGPVRGRPRGGGHRAAPGAREEVCSRPGRPVPAHACPAACRADHPRPGMMLGDGPAPAPVDARACATGRRRCRSRTSPRRPRASELMTGEALLAEYGAAGLAAEGT